MFSFKRKDDSEDIKSDLIFLDLSDSYIITKEDLDKALSKIPNLKLKPDPIDPNIQFGGNCHQKVVSNSKLKNIEPKKSGLVSDMSSISLKILFLNPIPEPMTELNLNDFCGTDIDWKMLTLLRPKTSSENEYFAKLVELYQLRHKTRIEDGFGVREAVFRLSRHPRVLRYKPISFTRMDSFGLETNQSSIKIKEDITYEAFARLPIDTSQNESLLGNKEDTIDDILSLTDSLDFKRFQN